MQIRFQCLLNAAVVFTAAFLLGSPVSAMDLLSAGETVTIKTKPIREFEIGRTDNVFGRLTFLGGLEVLTSNREIGGLSGVLSVGEGTQILAVTDNGHWVSADVDQEADGTPLALGNVRYAPMRRKNGETLRRIWGHDTEGLSIDGDTLLVSAERANTIYRFPWPLPTGNERMLKEVKVPQGVKELRGSKGLEAIAIGPKGSSLDGVIVAVGERGKSESHDLPGFLIGGGKDGSFTIARSDRYDATDAVFLPNGDFLLLERRFNLRDLVGMRLRRFDQSEIRPGARLVGETLLEAGYTFQIDNMEAIAVHQTAAGDTILTLLSDNNRSVLQRTLLLRFKLGVAAG